ncbi:MAG: exo-alpha-sialidase [Phycisphaerales bacterium]|nr:exo-alpha-sialidase [Phycisphaerales bacterium]
MMPFKCTFNIVLASLVLAISILPATADGPDAFSIAAAETCTSNDDCNGNGVPDDCDLDSIGRLEKFSPIHGDDFVLNGSATLNNFNVRLTQAVEGQNGSVIFDPVTSDPIDEFFAEFDFKMGGGNGADGISFVLIDADLTGNDLLPGEGGGNQPLSLSLDTYMGNAAGGNHAILRSYGIELASVEVPHTLDDDAWQHAAIEFSDGAVTVVLTDAALNDFTAFSDVAVPSFTPIRAGFGFGGRTGSVTNVHRVDNVRFRIDRPNDCDANGTPDECDIAGGTSADCNTNGVPDVCDTAPKAPLVASAPAPLNSNAFSDTGADSSPRLATDGAGHWIATWHSPNHLGGAIGTDYDVHYSRSADDGATWSAPAYLNSYAATDNSDDGNSQVATDGAGLWIAVWEAFGDLGGTIGTESDILYARSMDNGATWSAPSPLNTNAATDSGYDTRPQLTTDGGGNWIAVWATSDDLGGTIGTDNDIVYAQSTDDGVTWSAPAPLHVDAATDSAHDGDPQVSTDGAGNWVVVWSYRDNLGGTLGTDDDIVYSRSTDGGATWSSPAPLNSNADTDIGDDFRPQLTTDGAGNWIAVWASDDDLGVTIGTDVDVLYSRSTDGAATWSTAAPLNANAASDSGFDVDCQVTIGGTGDWIAVWSSSGNPDGTIGADPDLLYSRSSNRGATWSFPAPLNAEAMTDSGGDYGPQVATDGAGNWLAVWESYDDLGGTIGTDSDILWTRFSLTHTSLDGNHNGVPDECEAACGVGGDFDDDGDVDLTDYLSFAACLGGPAESADGVCACFDLDSDGDVDLRDVAYFQGSFSGPN